MQYFAIQEMALIKRLTRLVSTTKVNNLNIYIFRSYDFPITLINVSYYLSLVVYQELKVYSNSTVIFTFSLK